MNPRCWPRRKALPRPRMRFERACAKACGLTKRANSSATTNCKRSVPSGNQPPRNWRLADAGAAVEVIVDGFGGAATFGNCPDHERLSAAHIACGENPRHRAHIVPVGGDVAAPIEMHAELIEHSFLHRARESHRQQEPV